ncbi:dnaJ-like protein 60 isoform X2 [Scaptodrosophila lebanonensis]|nr:dnaJ-like protein 60 isoform X2 [Scaptodrosophila lebanonensis]XP_030387138.1 dnaJ-like protein 60 isoform X2 [Scaptodrosophila lebanonensis]
MKSNVANSANFVKISEAYHILVKPQTRKEYDRNLSWVATNDRVEQDSAPWEVRPNYTTNPGPYYGIKGLNRVSNLKVALFLLAVGIFGAIFGFGSVRHSFELNRQIQDEMSAEAISHHAAVVADAQKYGNEEQVRRMVERLSKDPYNQAISK